MNSVIRCLSASEGDRCVANGASTISSAIFFFFALAIARLVYQSTNETVKIDRTTPSDIDAMMPTLSFERDCDSVDCDSVDCDPVDRGRELLVELERDVERVLDEDDVLEEEPTLDVPVLWVTLDDPEWDVEGIPPEIPNAGSGTSPSTDWVLAEGDITCP